MKKNYSFLASLVFFIGISANLFSQSLTVSGSLFIPQDSVSITYADPAFTSTDWIGIYLVDDTPGSSTPSQTWDYVKGTDGTMKLAIPDAPGSYKAVLLCCDGYDVIATSATFTVEVPSLSSSKASYIQGDAVTFTYVSPKFSSTDWIGIYPKGTKPGDANPSIDWKYITTAAGSLTFDYALNPGSYDAYLLCCDGYDSISACTFDVLDATVAVIIPESILFAAGTTLEFTYNDPLFVDGDWIGIYTEYADPTVDASITWSKLVSKSGVVSFPGVISGGTYIAVLFSPNGTQTEYARSPVFEVQSNEGGSYVKTASSVYPEYSTILVNYRDKNFSATDWIGIYHKGDVPGESTLSLVFQYTPNDSGTIEFASTLPIGDYDVNLLCCDGYTLKASYSFKIVGSGTAYMVSSKIAYANGEALEFTFNSPSFVSTDWIGIYFANEIPGGDGVYSTWWEYIPSATGTMTFSVDSHGINSDPVSLLPGEYLAALFCCDAYGLYASTNFIVTEFGLGIKPEPGSSSSLNLYPNPSTGRVTVKVDKAAQMNIIKVYNITGQVVYQERPSSFVNEKVIDLKLSKGIYFVEVQTESSRISKKLIIQ